MKKKLLICLIAVLAFVQQSNSQTIADYNLLIVTGSLDTNAQTELIAMGHSVTIENPTNLTGAYDYSPYDAIIFMFDSLEPSGMPEILNLNTNNQLGIIAMRGENIIASADLGTAVFWSLDNFTIEDNSHYITQPFPLGGLDLGFSYKSELTAINSGNTILGSVLGGNGSLVVNDTYRKVICPYYGHPVGMPWNSDAEILMDRIIAWVSSNMALGVNDYESLKNITVYPIPSNDFIQLSGLTKTVNYKIYNILGTEVLKGTISDSGKIEIQNFQNGLYFLKFDNGNSMKFIKK